jgi:hypothetical protein
MIKTTPQKLIAAKHRLALPECVEERDEGVSHRQTKGIRK